MNGIFKYGQDLTFQKLGVHTRWFEGVGVFSTWELSSVTATLTTKDVLLIPGELC